ncbi:MAG: hypothetical protein FWF38_07340 [Spirochaetaceae bacterium]|nr:hypothetical protein [Spirochaetaceae bacterium]
MKKVKKVGIIFLSFLLVFIIFLILLPASDKITTKEQREAWNKQKQETIETK